MVGEKVLIVDDEKELLDLLSLNLEHEQLNVMTAQNGRQALQLIAEEGPDLVILDICLPDIDGIELCQEIRRSSIVPIIFLSGKSEDIDKIIGLSVGGDDYITKPFCADELIARVKAKLRRARLNQPTSDRKKRALKFPGLEIDPDSHAIILDNTTVYASTREIQLLTLLARNPNRVFHQDLLFELIWDAADLSDTRTVAVHISNLRKKIEKDPARPRFIITVRGAGYKFKLPET